MDTYSTPRSTDPLVYIQLSLYRDNEYIGPITILNGVQEDQELYDRIISGELGNINIAPNPNYRWDTVRGDWFLPASIIEPENLTNLNTAIDSNGFVRTASPVIRLSVAKNKETGEIEAIVTPVTREAQDADIRAIRIGTGRYIITGVLGTHEDELWSISIPSDINGNPLIFVDYRVAYQGEDVNKDGSYIANMGEIILDTYHRTYPDLPIFARNNLWLLEDGSYKRIPTLPPDIKGELVENMTDIDIPWGKNQFLDIRVNVPVKED